MTDNLRDRIADIISHALDTWEPLAGATEDTFVAQAIIDEFGLTIETHAATHAKRTMTRITGAWEWDNQ